MVDGHEGVAKVQAYKADLSTIEDKIDTKTSRAKNYVSTPKRSKGNPLNKSEIIPDRSTLTPQKDQYTSSITNDDDEIHLLDDDGLEDISNDDISVETCDPKTATKNNESFLEKGRGKNLKF